VQEAAQAQQQAFAGQQGNAMASAQAARALQQATAAMDRAVPESRRGRPGAADPANASADAAASAKPPSGQPAPPGTTPGLANDPKAGVRTAAGESPAAPLDERPDAVKELGVSPGDWARLGPLTRQELLNAAQQSGPPAYREQIKNYFVKIARLRADDEPTEARQ
jgi:hypothetical protein